jgi:hypothetical protein
VRLFPSKGADPLRPHSLKRWYQVRCDSFLFGVSPFHLPVLILAAVAIFLLALAASAIPAGRAATLDPMQALRASKIIPHLPRYTCEGSRGVAFATTTAASLPNIDADLLNDIVPIAESIPLWRVGLCPACHIRRPGGNHCGTRLLKAAD